MIDSITVSYLIDLVSFGFGMIYFSY